MCIQFPYILEDNYQRKRDKKTYIGSQNNKQKTKDKATRTCLEMTSCAPEVYVICLTSSRYLHSDHTIVATTSQHILSYLVSEGMALAVLK
jgi:hypothetical protein